MKISYQANIDNYINFLVTRSKRLPEGKNRRTRFYVGFSMLYFLFSIVVIVILINQRTVLDPYIIMLTIIFVVSLIYMRVVDTYSMVIARRFKKDASGMDLNKRYTLEKDQGTYVLKFDNKQERYNISENTMYYVGEEYVTLFFDQDTGVSIPIKNYNDEFEDLKRL